MRPRSRGNRLNWTLLGVLFVLDCVLVGLLLKGPLVDTLEHRKNVYNLAVRGGTNSEALRSYELSLHDRRRQALFTRWGIFAAILINGGAVVAVLVCSKNPGK